MAGHELSSWINFLNSRRNCISTINIPILKVKKQEKTLNFSEIISYREA